MTHNFVFDIIQNPNFLVDDAISKAYSYGNIVFHPGAVDGLTDSFTVIYRGEVVDGVQYFVGLYGEHDLEGGSFNPLDMNPLVIGVQLTDGRLTVTDALSPKDVAETINVANMLMIAQYGGTLTTDQQSEDPNNEKWTVLLEEYPEHVTCRRVAEVEHDKDTYFCYVGEGVSNRTTEHFLLIVQVIDGEFYSVDVNDVDLWNALRAAFLNHFDIETDDGSDDDDESEDDDSGGDIIFH